MKQVELLSKEELATIFDDLGGHAEFCKAFGYEQFAAKVQEKLLLNIRSATPMGYYVEDTGLNKNYVTTNPKVAAFLKTDAEAKVFDLYHMDI